MKQKYRACWLLAATLLCCSYKLSSEPAISSAPDFTLPDIKGRTVDLRNFGGQPVLIHFWATWCKPCVKEMPEIEAAYQALKDRGFIVLAINTGDRIDKVRAFVESRHFTFPVLLDKRWEIAERYNIIGLPVSIFIAPDGRIRHEIQGGTLTAAAIADIVMKME